MQITWKQTSFSYVSILIFWQFAAALGFQIFSVSLEQLEIITELTDKNLD